MSVHSLSGSFLSVLGPAERLPLRHFSDRSLAVFQCKSAAISRIFNYVRDWSGMELPDSRLYGASCEFAPEEAELKALGEAAERYTSVVITHDEIKVATAEELGDHVFDWTRLPQLSEAELSDPKQMLHPFSPQDSMRWIGAVDMHKQACVYVPIILTHLYPRAWTSERFTYPISTGTALHPDPWQAMLSATLEVIERDALSLNWILQRPLRRIHLQLHDAQYFDENTWKLLQQNNILLYEATTDLGVPVIYARRFRPAHPKAANVFGCACNFDIPDAIGKAARESIMIAHALECNTRQIPRDPFECTSLIDGASMMMAPERMGEFAFICQAGSVGLDELLQDVQTSLRESPRVQFELLVAKTKRHGQPLYVAEISCDEIKTAGLRAFRAIMPGLMPLSFVHRSRFLGSSRLSDMHRYWNLPGTLAQRVNPWPQPFS